MGSDSRRHFELLNGLWQGFYRGLIISLLSLVSYKPIVEFIDAQFEAYLQEELKIRRVLHTYHDSRIHACLYFIAPTGHSLKSLDLVTMKKLDSKVWRLGWAVGAGQAEFTLTDLLAKEMLDSMRHSVTSFSISL